MELDIKKFTAGTRQVRVATWIEILVITPHRASRKTSVSYVLEFVQKHPDAPNAKAIRVVKESAWIHRLHTMSPLGLNRDW
jgi:hypothetical protein